MRRGRRKKEELVVDIQIQEDVWAQCDGCQKWRRLPPGTVLDESQPWYCNLNPDKKYNSCSFPEEDWKSSGDKEISAAFGSELKAEAAKLALKKAAGHDLSASMGSGRGRKRQTDGDGSWVLLPKKLKAQEVATPVTVTSQRPVVTLAAPQAPLTVAAPAASNHVASAAASPPAAIKAFPSLQDEVKALSAGCSRILNNGGTWTQVLGPKGHLSQDHINIPQWFWTGMHHLVPQAAALAVAAVDVLTALQYSTGSQQSTAAAPSYSSLTNMLPKPPSGSGGANVAGTGGSASQAELYVRLSLMTAASMLQPVVKLVMQGGDLAAAVAAATKPLTATTTTSPLPPVAAAAASMAQPPGPLATKPPPAPNPAMTPTCPAPTLIPPHSAPHSPGQRPAVSTRSLRAGSGGGDVASAGSPGNGPAAYAPPSLQAAAASSPPAVAPPPPPTPPPPPASAAADVTPPTSQSPPAAVSGPTTTTGSGGGVGGIGSAAAAPPPPTSVGGSGCIGASPHRPGGSVAGSLSRASSPGTTSTAPSDTALGSSGRGDSREPRRRRESREPLVLRELKEPREPPRESRGPRERQRDPAYERHLQQPQQLPKQPTAPPHPGPGRPQSDRERDRERERREGLVRERGEREGLQPQYPTHIHTHYRDPRERERERGYPGPESPRQPYQGYSGADGGSSAGREWHDGHGERQGSRERERSYDRQSAAVPPPHYGGGYSGGSGGVGRDVREGPYGHHASVVREYGRGDRDRDREYYGHEGPARASEREGYYRGGGGGPQYGGYPPEPFRGDRDRGRNIAPQEWGGRERDWDYEGGGYGSGGHYEAGGGPGPYASGRSGGLQSHRGPPPPYGVDSYGPLHGYSQHGQGAGQLASPNRDRGSARGAHSSYPPYPHGGGPTPPPGGPPAASAAVPAAKSSIVSSGAGLRPLPQPPSLASLPTETVAKLHQGLPVKSAHVVSPTHHGQPPGLASSLSSQPQQLGSVSSTRPPGPAPSPLPYTAGSGLGSGQPMTVSQIRAAAAAAAAQKQQLGVYTHGSGSRGASGFGGGNSR